MRLVFIFIFLFFGPEIISARKKPKWLQGRNWIANCCQLFKLKVGNKKKIKKWQKGSKL